LEPLAGPSKSSQSLSDREANSSKSQRRQLCAPSHAEAAKIAGIASVERIFVAKSQRALKLAIIHAAPIVKDGDSAMCAVPDELDAYFGRACGNAVVDDVSQRGGGGIAKPPK
jgi:hypothetical protein